MRRRSSPVFLALLITVVAPRLLVGADEPGVEFFETKIRPVLVEHCYECHSAGAKSVKAGLLLDTREATLKGGDSGPAVVPNDLAASTLMEALRYDTMKMPPKGKLSDKVLADFEKWIAMGAPDPREGDSAAKPAGYDFQAARQFWSFTPPAFPKIPDVTNPAWPRNDVDRFTLQAMESRGLKPVRPADKRELIRRATFDLIGLPPTPEEVDAFLADESPEAFARVVERLLGSAHYGERWARYWLDVARFAEDQAHTFDVKPNTSGYRYRDWVIKAFNTDLPFDQFVKYQIAGDLLDGQGDEKYDRLTALGYFGLGAQYYKNSDAARAAADELDDRVDTLSRGFLGLTISCARCHDHKFDPIPQQDYYSLAGIFQSSKLANLPLVPSATVEAYNTAQARIKEQDEALKKFLATEKTIIRESQATQLARYMQAGWQLRATKRSESPMLPSVLAKTEGLELPILERTVKFLDTTPRGKYPALDSWLEVAHNAEGASELGANPRYVPAMLTDASQAFQSKILEILAERDGKPRPVQANLSPAGSTGTARHTSQVVTKTKPTVEIEVEIAGARELYLVVTDAGNGIRCDHADWLEPRLIGPGGEKKLTDLKWKSASAGSGSVLVNQNGIGQGLKVAGKPYQNGIGTHALSIIAYDLPAGFTHFKAIGGLDNSGSDQAGDCGDNASIQFRVYTEAPTDLGSGTTPPALSQDKTELLAAILGDKGLFAIPDDQFEKLLEPAKRDQLLSLRSNLDEAKKQAPPMYPVAHAISEGAVADMPVFIRGNPANKGELAPRRFLRVLAGDQQPAFTQGSGRLELASAIADPTNPLTSRVMANRIWQHHFGRGLVGTPDNFGSLGEPPTHPELLNYLARRFVDSNWSVKAIHREIMLSATYQQSSDRDEQNFNIDPDNRFLWRMNRQRLDVEAWRDALLAVSGRLDRIFEGPSTNLADSSNNRRTVYARVSRHELDGMLRLFDFPDANITSSKRSETTVPQQQLFVMNSPFMLEQAKALAARVQAEVPNNPVGQIQRAFQLAYSRPATNAELEIGQTYLQGKEDEQSARDNKLSRWERYAQILLASNEFMYLD